MRTRRSLTTAIALTVALTATTLSAANRDTAPNPRQKERAGIVTIVKRVLAEIIRAFPEPTLPIPGNNT